MVILGYLVTLLQLYATDVFGFGTKQNGWLIFIFSLLRSVFLTLIFPQLIALGRRLTSNKQENALRPSEEQPLLSTPPTDPQAKSQQTFAFDLTYTKASLLADGFLTLLCSFVHQGWQMYLVATILPFASGTGSASKGTILQMLGGSATSSERTDALAGISLVENMARLSTSESSLAPCSILPQQSLPPLSCCTDPISPLSFSVWSCICGLHQHWKAQPGLYVQRGESLPRPLPHHH